MNIKTYRDSFTVNGNASYATTHEFLENSTLVFLNGVLLRKGVDYNEGSDYRSIVPIEDFTAGWDLEIYYILAGSSDSIGSTSVDELLDILNAVIDIKRDTPFLLDKSLIAALMSVDRQPDRPCRLGISISGATVALGTISVAGTTDETFVFDANETIVGEKDYTTITGIAIAGISDGTIEIKAITKTGQPINQEKVIHKNLPVYFYKMNGRVRMSPAGKENIVRNKFMTLPDKLLDVNDIFYAVSGIRGMTCGRLDFIDEIMDFAGATHHIEAEVIPL